MRHLKGVLDRLRKANLKLKVAKCVLFCEQVQYLGHNISKQGIASDPAKFQRLPTFQHPLVSTSFDSFSG